MAERRGLVGEEVEKSELPGPAPLGADATDGRSREAEVRSEEMQPDPVEAPQDPVEARPDRVEAPADSDGSRRKNLWERARRGMADHNAKAPRGPMGIPEIPDATGTDDDGADVPPEATAELILKRVHHYRDTIRSYQVLIEGERVGQIRDDATERFALRPGSYTLRLQLLWLFSHRVVVELPANSQTRMICGPCGGILQAWRLFLTPTKAIFLRHAEEVA